MTQEEWKKSVQWVGVVAGCLVVDDNKFLLVQEKQKKVYGLWNLPAGFVDKGEDISTAAMREAKEETGYTVELLNQIGLYHENSSTPVKHIFMAKITGGELKIQEDEILDVKWLSFDEVKKLHKDKKLRADWIWGIISKYKAS